MRVGRAGRGAEPHSQLHVLCRRGAAGPAAVAGLPPRTLENTTNQGSVFSELVIAHPAPQMSKFLLVTFGLSGSF